MQDMQEPPSTLSMRTDAFEPDATRAGLAPRLHVLKLHESAIGNGNDYSRFRQRWIVYDPESRISPGDLVYFPELLTGAGEFEGLRFAVAMDTSSGTRGIELLCAGVEMPAFPDPVMALVSSSGCALRELYHDLFDQMLLAQGLSMEQICEGCEDGADGLWSDVAAGHCRLRPRATQGQWDIPLEQCQYIDN